MLFRHAKSAWNEPGLPDFDRALNRRGRMDAPLMGTYMKSAALLPDYSLISPARRTRDTWSLLSQDWGMQRHGYDERIYEASAETLLGIMRATPKQITTLMLLGHNPGMQDMACDLAKHDNNKMRLVLDEKFPTAALCVLDFASDDWGGILENSGMIERFVTPRSLGYAPDDT